MPTHCCIPLCPKKVNRDEVTGQKISFFRFTEDETLRKQWLHANQRDVGPYFTITEGARVCSRHFKPEDLRKTPRKTKPKTGAVPSVFAWKQSSPPKLPPPTPRSESVTSKKNSRKGSGGITIKGSESCQSEDPTSTMADLQFPETTEIEPSTEAESASDCAENSNEDSLILEGETICSSSKE